MAKKETNKKTEETPSIVEETKAKETKVEKTKVELVEENVDVKIDYPKGYSAKKYYKDGSIHKNMSPITANMLLKKKIAKLV